MRHFKLYFLALVSGLFCSCGDDVAEVQRDLDADMASFVQVYNRYIEKWLVTEEKEISERLGSAEESLRADIQSELDVVTGRRERGDYFQFLAADALPELEWENGADEPEIGDPRAVKGGSFRYYMTTFPPTLRSFGSNANGPWRSLMHDEVTLGLVSLHPHTGNVIPGVAKEWAESSDGTTAYFRVDPDARYTTGEAVSARDILVSVYTRLSDFVVAPFQKQYFREQIAGFTFYGDDVVAVHAPSPKPFLALNLGSFAPSSPTFYKDYGPDFVERYNWVHAPSTGPYRISDSDVKKGVSITLNRDPNWWAQDKKFWRYRFNPDRMVYKTIRDDSKAMELFRVGELDYFTLSSAESWYEKSEIPPVFDGHIERYTFYNQYPRVPFGLHVNAGQGLMKDRNIRIGLQFACDWQRVIDVLFRGDYDRLDNFTTGFGEFDLKSIKARPFDPEQARQLFAKAGFTERDSDGILKRSDGTRLEIPVTYSERPRTAQMITLLQEGARKAGLDLRLDGKEGTVMGKFVREKNHHAVFWGWGAGPPSPAYHQFLHSKNAFDDKGQMKPDTNNIYSFSDPKVDKLTDAYQSAKTVEEMIPLAHKLQQIIHDEAIFVPAYAVTYQRFGNWRWLKWPDTESSRLMPQGVYYPYESHVFWIDQEIKRETVEAMRSGETFPEVQEVWDDYK